MMRAPQVLTAQRPASAVMGDASPLTPGTIVYVAHRQAGQQDNVMLLAAEVIAVESRHNMPLLSLRSLNGQSIEPGDSGGGVWVNGQFVGNLWMTVREEQRPWWSFGQPVQTDTARSYAAGLTAELLDLISVVSEPQETPPLQSDSPS